MSHQSRILVLASSAPAVGAFIGNMAVEGLGKIFRCDENTPSIHGSRFLGHEGEWVRYAYLVPAAKAEGEKAVVAERKRRREMTDRERGRFTKVHPVQTGSLQSIFEGGVRQFFRDGARRSQTSAAPFVEIVRMAIAKGVLTASFRMRKAWDIAATTASRLGGSARQYLGAVLRAFYAVERSKHLSDAEAAAAAHAAYAGRS